MSTLPQSLRVRFNERPPITFQSHVNLAMDEMNYLHAELSGDEDPGLSQTVPYQNAPDAKYMTPPGVRTLSQWGQQVIPSGKMAGKTFAEVFEDDHGYTMQVKSRRAVAPWLRSFQNYLTARWKHRALAQHQHQVPVIPTQGTSKAAKTASSSVEISGIKGLNTDKEWEKVPTTSRHNPNKRASSASNSGSQGQQEMTTEPDQDKISQLQAQIAILQRQLALETRIPDEA
eukprot:s374_g9.t1